MEIQFCSEWIIAYYRAENKAYRNEVKGSFVVEKWFRQIHLGSCVLQKEEWNDQEQKTGRLSEVLGSLSLLCKLPTLSQTSVCFLPAMAAESFCWWFFTWYRSFVNFEFDQLSLVCIGAKMGLLSVGVYSCVFGTEEFNVFLTFCCWDLYFLLRCSSFL